MKTPRVANKSARLFVQQRMPFRGSNTRGLQLHGGYVALSYHAPIFIYAAGMWFSNQQRYSVTTSRHMSQLHPLAETVDLPEEAMRSLFDRLVYLCKFDSAESVVAEVLTSSLPTA